MPGRLIAIALVVLLVLVFGIVVGVSQLTSSGSANNTTDDSVDVVLNDLDKVSGKRIAVEGDIKTLLPPNAILLGSSDATQRGLLVVPKDGDVSGLRMNAHVHVTGVAQPFDLATFSKQHPDARRTPAIRGLDGQPSILEATVER
jgi:hypothetical protein